MLTEHYLEPSHIILTGGGFALHPGLGEPLTNAVRAVDGLLRLAARYHGFHTTRFIGTTELHILTTTTGLHAPATLNQVVFAWITVMDRIAIAMRELKALCIGNAFDPARRNWPSRIPAAIQWLPVELQRKLPAELLATHNIHPPSVSSRPSKRTRTPSHFVVDHTSNGRSVLVPIFPPTQPTMAAEFTARPKVDQMPIAPDITPVKSKVAGAEVAPARASDGAGTSTVERGELKRSLRSAESSHSETGIRATMDSTAETSLRANQLDGQYGYPAVPRADGAVDVCGYPPHRASSAENRQAPPRLVQDHVAEDEIKDLFVSDQRRADSKQLDLLTCPRGPAVSPSFLAPARASSPSLLAPTPGLVFDRGRVEPGGLRAMIVQEDMKARERELTARVHSISLPPDFLELQQAFTPQIVSEEDTVESGGLQADGATATRQVRSLDGGLIVRDGPREASLPVAFPACGVIDTYFRASSTVQYDISVTSEPTGTYNAPAVEPSAAGLATPTLVSPGRAAVPSLPLVGDDRTAIAGTQRGRVRLLVHRYDAMSCGTGTVENGGLKGNSGESAKLHTSSQARRFLTSDVIANASSLPFSPGAHFKGDHRWTVEDGALVQRAASDSARSPPCLATAPLSPKSPAPAIAIANAVELGGLRKRVAGEITGASRDAAPSPMRLGAAFAKSVCRNIRSGADDFRVERGGLVVARKSQRRNWVRSAELRRTLDSVACARGSCLATAHPLMIISSFISSAFSSVTAYTAFAALVSAVVRTTSTSYLTRVRRGELAPCLAWAREGIGTTRARFDAQARERGNAAEFCMNLASVRFVD
ncbi:hypothetical protein C8R47DRAFT_1210369 [Mycena vitilis]|nr:hypothetical protein C8R47DRAFT_1210369 [Mycena vitilis]